MNKQKTFIVRMEKELREKIAKAAKENGMSSSAWIRMIAIEKLRDSNT